MKSYFRRAQRVLIVLLMMGCTHKLENDIQKKVEQESHINTVEDFNQESDKIIEEAEGISDAQRAKLIVLRRETLAKIQEQDQQEMKLRLVLFKETLKTDENRREINLLKQKIRRVNRTKYSLLAEAMKESNRILGKPYAESNDAFEFERPIREPEIRQ